MKRLEILIDDETDAMLDEMLASGVGSKEAIARRLIEEGVRVVKRQRSSSPNGTGKPPYSPEELEAFVEEWIQKGVLSREPAPPDPLDAIIGSIHDDPVDDIDEVIYGR